MAKTKRTKPKPDGSIDDLNALESLLEGMFGAGVVMRGGMVIPVDAFPTNIASLDIALGCGGIPRGRVVELFGPESSGKTTTALQIVLAAQKHYFEDKQRHGVAAFIDAEHALDPEWATKIGIAMDDVLISQPDSGDQALQIAEKMAQSGVIDIIIIDSVAALVPQKELDGELTDTQIGLQAQMMSKAMRRLNKFCKRSGTTIIFINQIRSKIGVTMGSSETTPGGRALKFYASIRIDVRKISAIKSGDAPVGATTIAKIVKNKVAPPFQKAEYDICFGLPERPVHGVDIAGSLIETGIAYKIVSRSGANYRYGDQHLGAGIAKAGTFLRENQDVAEEIKGKIYSAALGDLPRKAVSDAVEDDESSDDDDQAWEEEQLEDE